MEKQSSNTVEGFILLAIVAIVGLTMFVMAFAEEIGIAIMLIGLVLALWLIVWLMGLIWRFVGDTHHRWADRTQARQLQATTVQTRLMLECKRSELAYAVDGHMPVAHAAIVSGEYNKPLLELNAMRVQTLTPVANVPHTLTYAPHLSQKSEAGAQQQMAPVNFAPPTDFFGLFMAGKLPRDRFLVGTSIEDGSEVTATWQNLYSALIGGQSGSGKSTLIRSLLAQSALQGGKFVVIDPHFDAGEESLGASLMPLRNLMLCDVASNDREMVAALDYVERIGQARLHGADSDRTPVVLVVDETTALLQRGNVADRLTDVLGMIAQETRKVGLFAFCIGQNFSGKVLPTEVRNSFVSFISCRARRDVARVQSGSAEFGEAAAELTIGQCVWMTPSGEMHRVSVPNCTENHLNSVAQSLGEITVGSATSAALPNHFQTTSAEVENAIVEVPRKCGGSGLEVPAEVVTLTPQERLIIEMFRGGESRTKIIRDVFGVTGGRKFEDAALQMEAAIRKAMV